MQGNELREIRSAAGLSQAKLATAIGLSRETVNQMENGKAPIERRTALAVRYVALVGVEAADEAEPVQL